MVNGDVVRGYTNAISAVGDYWREDWSDFDGRSLRDQISDLNYILYEHHINDEEKMERFNQFIEDLDEARAY